MPQLKDIKPMEKEEAPKKDTYKDRYKKVYGTSHLTPDPKMKKPEPPPKSTWEKIKDFFSGPSKTLEKAAGQ